MATSSRRWLIYALDDPRDGATRYVGITRMLVAERLARHVNCGNRHVHPKHAWIQELKTLRLRPEIRVLDTMPADSVELDVRRAEARWISELSARGAALTNHQRHVQADTKPRVIPGDAPELLRTWRGERTEAVAAAMIGISQPHYHYLEAGRRIPGGPTVYKAMKVACVPIEAWGFDRIDATTPPAP